MSSVDASVTFLMDAHPASPDLTWPVDFNGSFIAAAVLRPLFTGSELGAAPVSSCAAVVTPLDDGRRWRICLERAVRWSDGKVLTTAEVAAAADRVASKPRSGPARWLAGVGSPVDVVDAATLDYRFDRPISFAPWVLTMPPFAPFRPEARDGHVALGAFRAGGRVEHGLTLKANPHHQAREDSPTKLRFRVLEPTERPAALYDRGCADVTPPTGLSAAEAETLAGRADAVSRQILLFACLEIGPRLARMRNSAELRNALAAMIDRDRLAAVVGHKASPLWSPLQPWGLGPSASAPVRPRDREGLAAALRGACLSYADFPPNGEVVDEIARQLREELGVELALRALDFGVFLRQIANGGHELCYTLTGADFLHPAGVLGPWRSTGAAATQTGFSDGELDRRIALAEQEFDEAGSMVAWGMVADRWCDVMPRVPLLLSHAACLRAERLRRFQLDARGIPNFEVLGVADG